MTTAAQRVAMARAIVKWEARRDRRGRLAVYKLPAGDGGGTYEVAGINDRYHPRQAAKLKAMIRRGLYDEAEDSIAEYLVIYTNAVKTWSSDPGVEFFLRDTAFNRGPAGAAKILQMAVGAAVDGVVGPKTRAALAALSPDGALDRLRAARERYEREVARRDETSRFWRGLVNRWNDQIRVARQMSAQAGGAVFAPPPKPVTRTIGDLDDMVEAFIAAAGKRGVTYASGEALRHIGYVEGMNVDGSLNDDVPDGWNDLRFVFRVVNGDPEVLGAWEATTEPGRRYTISPINPGGAARIEFGHYTSWQVGLHRGDHEALVQTGGPVTVCRDANKDFVRPGDYRDRGYFGINQHHGHDASRASIGGHSAGCLVGRSVEGHKAFMSLVKQDERYAADRRFVFSSTILPADELVAAQ